MGGVLSPVHILALGILFIVLIVFATILVLKREQNWFKLIWILFVLFIPFIGSIVYILNYYLNTPQKLRTKSEF